MKQRIAGSGLLLAFCVLFALRLFVQFGEYERIMQIPQETNVIVEGQIYKKELRSLVLNLLQINFQ